MLGVLTPLKEPLLDSYSLPFGDRAFFFDENTIFSFSNNLLSFCGFPPQKRKKNTP